MIGIKAGNVERGFTEYNATLQTFIPRNAGGNGSSFSTSDIEVTAGTTNTIKFLHDGWYYFDGTWSQCSANQSITVALDSYPYLNKIFFIYTGLAKP